ncbi:hypothetical protein GPUN_0089 [Glaciecola punicea ACAM 611]|jgi:hypothetical protein|uniref:Uncharacterized protein n=1 Tax=Glaciecola punicea ACAM 611 TaxID=1121923 RepID=H5T7G6_9ALTE|nr:hypothetical protein [Glaciecola punicea]OFA32875.1 hypothetical protein BAE46_03780 [Glaciecola punicea]GAB54243.1 hypothetical protein GPUN_0089 [Glaciecola punicea ACAM 611]
MKARLPVAALLLSEKAKYIYIGPNGRDVLNAEDVSKYENKTEKELDTKCAKCLATGLMFL